MNRAIDNIKYVDIFPENTGFTDKGKKNFRSWFGVSLSFLVISSSLILTLMFGKEVYERKKLLVSISEEFTSVSQVSLVEWPVFMVISDDFGNKIDTDGYYTFQTFKINYTSNNLVDYSNWAEDLFFVSRCTIESFNRVKHFVSDEKINAFVNEMPSYCVHANEEAVIQNPYKSTNSSFLNIHIRRCNITSNVCAENYDMVVSQAYVEFYFVNSYIDSLDYSNPVKYYYDSVNTQISPDYLKRNFLSISNDRYTSDNGWILEAAKETNILALHSIRKEVNSLAGGLENDNLWITLEAPSIRKLYSRNYLKVQDLFARIGGLVNAFMIIIQIVFCHFFRYNYIMSLRKYLNPNNKSSLCDASWINKTNNHLQDKNDANKVFLGSSNFENVGVNRNLNENNNNNEEIKSKTLVERVISKPNINNYNNLESNNNDYNINDRITNNENNNIRKINSPPKYTHTENEELNRNNSNKSNINDDNYKVNNYLEKKYINSSNVNIKNQTNSINNLISPNKALISVLNKNTNTKANLDINKDYKDNNKHIPLYVQSNLDNTKAYKIKRATTVNSISLFNIYDNNQLKYEYVDFNDIHYLKYLYFILTYSKKEKIYNKIRDEIDSLFDIYSFSSFLKQQYMLGEESN